MDQPEELLDELSLFDFFLWWCFFVVVVVVDVLLEAEASSAKAGTVTMPMPSTRVLVASAMMVFFTNPPREFPLLRR